MPSRGSLGGAEPPAGRHLHQRKTSGRGYLALAALIVGRWSPWGAAAACLTFGAAEAFEFRLQGFGIPVSSYLVQMAPYVVALAVLAGLGRSAKFPAAIGQPLPRREPMRP